MSTAKQMGANYDPAVDGGDYVSYGNLYEAEFFRVFTALKDVFAGIIHGSSFPRQIYTDRPYLAEQKQSLAIFEGTPTEAVVKDWASGARLNNDLTVTLSQNAPIAFGYGGQDTFNVSAISGTISGGDGIDTVILSKSRDQVDVKTNSNVFSASIPDSKLELTVSDLNTSSTTLSLESIERVQFSDTMVAYDLDGNAGEVVKLLSVLLGKESATNKDYLRDGLKILDDGTSYEQLMNLALNFVLGANPSGAQVIDLLYTNVVGTETPQAYLDDYGALIDSGSITPAQLAISVGNHSLTANELDLIGLAQTGIEYAFVI